MQSIRRSFIVLLTVTALGAVFAVSAYSADREFPASVAATLKPATVGVQACRSNAFYAGRQVVFRTKIARQQIDTPQKLAIRVQLWRKFDEDKHYKRLKLTGEGGWNTASDTEVGIYQHDVILGPDFIETRASYRVKVTFRWANATTGLVESKKTTWSKPCHQKTKLPRLRVAGISSVPVPGVAKMTHTIRVNNTGASEAVDIPVGVFVDSSASTIGTIDSIAPGGQGSIQITVPSCENFAYTLLQPTPTLKRRSVLSPQSTNIPLCK